MFMNSDQYRSTKVRFRILYWSEFFLPTSLERQLLTKDYCT